MYVVRKLNGAHYFSMGFDLGPRASVSMNAIYMYVPLTTMAS